MSGNLKNADAHFASTLYGYLHKMKIVSYSTKISKTVSQRDSKLRALAWQAKTLTTTNLTPHLLLSHS